MGQPIAVLGVLVAVVAAALRWDLPARPAPAPAAPAVRIKPRIVSAIRPDDSNSSYAALGVRACPLPERAPEWSRGAVSTLERMNRSVTWTLKDLARKSILGRVSKAE